MYIGWFRKKKKIIDNLIKIKYEIKVKNLRVSEKIIGKSFVKMKIAFD